MNKLEKNAIKFENVMPLLMYYTSNTKIQEADDCSEALVYNDEKQVLEIDMRIVGTKSLKSSSTGTARGVTLIDQKNEIDDQKTVN